MWGVPDRTGPRGLRIVRVATLLQLLRRRLGIRIRHSGWQSGLSVAFGVEHSAPKVNTNVAPLNARTAIGSHAVRPLAAATPGFPEGQRAYSSNHSAAHPSAMRQTRNSKQKFEGF